MHESVVIQLAGIIVLGVGSQWLASSLRLPSILVLLLCGFVAGPVTNFLQPEVLFPGTLLPDIVSLCLAVILFEGGLTLKLSEAKAVGKVVARMVTVGVIVTWLLSAYLAHLLFDLDQALSLLLGAILVLSGPTVIAPLLRHLRPRGKAGAVLKWEGIVIDPIGALLAALVFQALATEDVTNSPWVTIKSIILTIVIGGSLGAVGGLILIGTLRKHLVPDHLQAPATLAVLIASYVTANALQHESGLVTATLMGFLLANQKSASVHHITSFKEHLTLVIIACLFVVLAATLPVDDLIEAVYPRGLLFLAALLFLVRPLSVFVSTFRSDLTFKDKLFLSWMFPRGIVAAAGAPFFAHKLQDSSPEAAQIVPLTFLVIVGTVSVYGLTAPWVARRLHITSPNPQGLLLVGGHPLARAIASGLQESHIDVMIVDTNWRHIAEAKMNGLRAKHLNILAEDAFDQLDLGGIGRLLAVTANDEVNALAAVHATEVFGRANVYQLASDRGDGPEAGEHAPHLRGRIAFGEAFPYPVLARRFSNGWVVKRTTLSKDFDEKAFYAHYEDNAVPLFAINQDGMVTVIEAGKEYRFDSGTTLISLVNSNSLG